MRDADRELIALVPEHIWRGVCLAAAVTVRLDRRLLGVPALRRRIEEIAALNAVGGGA